MIIIKHHPAIQFAHLYEHLFCMSIQRFFRNHALFPYLDYHLNAQTLHKGIIYIHLTCYTKEAKALLQRIPTLQIDTNDVLIAATQIIAEKERPVGMNSLDECCSSLISLDKELWRNIDDLESIDLHDTRTKIGAFFFNRGAPKPARRLTISIRLDSTLAASRRELLPLFFQLASLIGSGLQVGLAIDYGMYESKTTTSLKRTISLQKTFKVAYRTTHNLKDIASEAAFTLVELRTHGGFKRLIADLKLASHEASDRPLPNIKLMLDDSGILMGAKGWHKIATHKNYTLLLQNMQIEIKLGRERSTQPCQ